MKIGKRLVSLLVSLVLLLGCFGSTSVLAAENNKTTIPEEEYLNGTESLVLSSANQMPSVPNDLSGNALSDGLLLGDLTGNSSNNSQRSTQGLQRSPVSVTQSFTGYFAAAGNMDYILLDLDPGTVVQATLQTPPDNNIDYTLYLFTVTNGALDQLAAFSALETYVNSSSGTLNEMLGYKESGTTTQTYALVVLAEKGFSTTQPFTLNVSLDLETYLDPYEMNDNPVLTTYSAPVGIPALTGSTYFTGFNLNVPTDNDWFVWTAPASTTTFDRFYAEAQISGTPAHKVEVYKNISTSATQLKLERVSTANRVPEYFEANTTYYIRVWSDAGANLNTGNYEFQIYLVPPTTVVADDMYYQFNGDEGPKLVNYDPYGASFGEKFRYADWLRPIIILSDSAGNRIYGATVTLHLKSSFWSSTSPYDDQYFTATTDINGEAVFAAYPAETFGTYSFYIPSAINFTHYIDVDELTFTSGNASCSTSVFRLCMVQ